MAELGGNPELLGKPHVGGLARQVSLLPEPVEGGVSIVPGSAQLKTSSMLFGIP